MPTPETTKQHHGMTTQEHNEHGKRLKEFIQSLPEHSYSKDTKDALLRLKALDDSELTALAEEYGTIQDHYKKRER